MREWEPSLPILNGCVEFIKKDPFFIDFHLNDHQFCIFFPFFISFNELWTIILSGVEDATVGETLTLHSWDAGGPLSW